jgi:diguanylate cyclase (GGDEF)-like protein/PAS domain S-box-containing protein/excisionase family DNA binding protein
MPCFTELSEPSLPRADPLMCSAAAVRRPAFGDPMSAVAHCAPGAAAISVVLVEDNDVDALLVVRRLERAAFDVTHVTTLAEALAQVPATAAPLCFLLDLSLPDAEGIEGLERLVASAPTFPIVVLTGTDDERVGLEALAAGAQDYLVKGRIGDDSVERAIRYAVERKNNANTLAEARERFRRTFEDGPLGIMLVDLAPHDAPRIVEGNRALAGILGRPEEALAGTRIDEITHWQERAALAEVIAELASGRLERAQVERRLIHADGHVVSASVTASTVRDASGQLLYAIVLVEDVTERERYDAALRDAHTALDSAVLGIALVDVAGRVRTVNPFYAATLGYRAEEIVGMSWQAMVHPDDHAAMEAAIAAVLGGTQATVEVSGVRKDGSALDEEIVLVPNLSADGTLTGYHHFMRDVTERRVAERALAASESRYRRIVETANEGVVITDADGEITFVNETMAQMLGWSDGDMLGNSAFSYFAGADLDTARQNFERLRDGAGDRVDYRLRHRDGHEVWGLVSVAPLFDGDTFNGILAMVSDITDRKQAEEQLTQLALRDSLTGLPNRTLLDDRLARALVGSRDTDRIVALLFIDLDRFKTVNDGFGHETGDELLRRVAERQLGAVRATDTLARFGGDEFVVLCEDLHHEREAVAVAERLQQALCPPITLESGSVVTVTASIGLALSSGGSATAEELMRDADTAMYRAKRGGGGRHEVFEASMRGELLEQLELERDLRQALAEGQLHLHYQPIVGLPDESVRGMEALLRWEHPVRGPVSPGVFIPVAEQTSLIVDIGRWVLQQACRQIAHWTAREDHGWARVAVNVSARQVDDPRFPQEVRELLETTGIEPHRLELEITETTLFANDTAVTTATLAALGDLGVRVILDDFGTGYSSLSYLAKFPLHGLKLDRQFIADLDGPDANRPIVEAVTAMAQSLGLTLVGEGVETVQQASLLAALQCDHAQGYLFARPMAPDAVEGWIETQVKHLTDVSALMAAEPSGAWMTLGEAADVVGVSASTLRRWADEGRIAVQRTSGGHRRFAVADLKRLARTSTQARIHAGSPPEGPLPRVAAVLDADGERLTAAVATRLYEKPTRGWFMSDRARRPLRQWLEALSGACRCGEYEEGAKATAVLMRHAEIGGASMLECGLFAERFGHALLGRLQLGGVDRGDALASAQRFAAVIRHAVLAER